MSDPRSRYRGYSFTPTSQPRRLDGWTIERRQLRRQVRLAVGVVVVALVAMALVVVFG